MRLLVPAFLTLSLVGVAHAGDDDRYNWDRGRFELGPRVGSLTLTDDSTEAVLPMGGFGSYIRWRATRRLAFEGTADVFFSDELAGGDGERRGEVTRVTAPITINGQLFLFPEWRFQVYLLGGIGVASHSVQYDALGESTAWATPVAQLGVGGQYRWNGLRLDVSLRSLYMHRDGDAMHTNEIPDGNYTPKTVDYQPLGGDRDTTGVMFNVALGWGVGR